MNRRRLAASVALGSALLAVPVYHAARSLIATRGAVATFAALLASGESGDLGSARRLCSARYRAHHPIEAAPGGGLVGFPRTIHKNFRAWREGSEVWLCPTDRVGPVYRFVLEGDAWAFDGPVGVLRAGGRVDEASDGGEIP